MGFSFGCLFVHCPTFKFRSFWMQFFEPAWIFNGFFVVIFVLIFVYSSLVYFIKTGECQSCFLDFMQLTFLGWNYAKYIWSNSETLLSQRTIGIALPGTFATIWRGVIWEKRQDPSTLSSGMTWLKTGVVIMCFGFLSSETSHRTQLT